MSELLIGIAVGVIATIIGFTLTMIWDIYKYKRDVKNKEETILSSVKEEFVYNIEALKFNKELLEKELKIIDKKSFLADPLTILQSGFWDVLKIQCPQVITKADTLRKIRYVAQRTNQINEVIRSREEYRISNQAMSNFHSRLKSFDELLMKLIEILEKSLEEIYPLMWNE